MSERTRLESASNGIDNARYFIERTESPGLLQQAKHASMWWEMFAEELAAQLLVAGHAWSDIAEALKLPDDSYVALSARRRADDLLEADGAAQS